MNTKEQIEKAMETFWKLDPNRERPCVTGDGQVPGIHIRLTEAIAEHLAAVLPVTVDDLMEVLGEFNKCRGGLHYVKLFSDFGGGLYEGASDEKLVPSPYQKKSGCAFLAAIKAAMTPEPTAKEKALEALDRMTRAIYSNWQSEFETIRRALEK